MPAPNKNEHQEIKRKNGFSLLEVLIAIFFITVTVFIFLKTTDTLGRIGRARHQTTAYHIAAKKIEDLRNASFASLPSSGSFSDSQLSSLPQGVASITVADYDPPSTKIKQVTVTVSWQEQSKPYQVSLSTLISQGGLHR
jgi:Tfp pilus assembly protein PilV